MEVWSIILLTLSLLVLIKPILNNLSSSTTHKKLLPPGPSYLPIIGNLFWLKNSIAEIEPLLRKLISKHGPMVTVYFGSRPTVYIASHALSHQALVQNGEAFADRPPQLPLIKILTANQHDINNSFYSPLWRLLRRNLTSGILHSLRVRSYSKARKRALNILARQLKSQHNRVVRVSDHFQYAIFSLLVLMCFGDDVNEKQIKEVEEAQMALILRYSSFNVLNFWPRASKILFRKKWQEFHETLKQQKDVFLSLIRARAAGREGNLSVGSSKEEEKSSHRILCYVDTLLGLELPDEKRKLNDDEIVSLCSEFLNAGVDTTSTALEWIMANLVKHPYIQEKLFSEIRGVVSPTEVEVKEEDLQKMPYLKAVILEGLRRHPPFHFLSPHAVTEDVVLDGYVIPQNGSVNFMVAEMGMDPQVWEDPLEFKPERFMSDDNGGREGVKFDITGSREIKMMPFGVGRRMCPGYQFGMLHLEYFVANLVWNFEWKTVDGEEVDFEEKSMLTVVMKNPLHVQVSPRFK